MNEWQRFAPPPEQSVEYHHELTREDLIRLGDIDDPSTKYTRQLQGFIASQENLYRELQCLTADTSKEVHGEIRRVLRRLVLRDPARGGIGYLTSSLGQNTEYENMWTGLVAKTFKERPAKPIVIEIDALFSFYPKSPSLVRKVKMFSEGGTADQEGIPYVLVASGVTDSKLFPKRVMERIPRQTQVPNELEKFFVNSFQDMLRNTSSPLDLLERWKKIVPKTVENIDEDINVLLAWCLLRALGNWQGLWYEGEEKGVGLYIVAPAYFHDAIIRVRSKDEYQDRSKVTFGSNDNPVFDRSESGEIILEFPMRNRGMQGDSLEQCQERLVPLAEELSKAVE